MNALPLDLFYPHDDTELILQEVSRVKQDVNNVRKGLFSRFNNLEKLLIEEMRKNEFLEHENQRMNKKIEQIEMHLQANQ